LKLLLSLEKSNKSAHKEQQKSFSHFWGEVNIHLYKGRRYFTGVHSAGHWCWCCVVVVVVVVVVFGAIVVLLYYQFCPEGGAAAYQ
jgi:hypothetical protein